MYRDPKFPDDHFYNKYCHEPTSWFEFILDDTGDRLKSHLERGLYPPPAHLISIFVDKASSQIMNNDGVSVHREYAPRLMDLAIQTCSQMKWRHEVLHSMPIVIRQKLLSHLVKTVVPEEIRASDISQRRLADVPKDSLGCLFLYHHWIHCSFIQLQLPQKLEKKDCEFPGFQPPQQALGIIQQELPHSISFLQKIVDEKPTIELPTLSKHNCNGDTIILDNNFAVIQAYYDLGELCFFNKSYADSNAHFKEAFKLLNDSNEPFVSFTKSKLSRYLDGLQFLTGCADIRDSSSIISRLEMTKASNYQGCIEILLHDNFRRELSLVHRQNFVNEVSECCNEASMYKQAYLANVLLEVIIGNGVSHNFWDFLKTDKDLVLDFLISATINYLENEGVKQKARSNLKVFFMMIMTKKFMKNKSNTIISRIGKQLGISPRSNKNVKADKTNMLKYESSKEADLAASYRELASTANFSKIKDVISQICQLQPNFHMRTFCEKLFKEIRHINYFLPLLECFACPRPLSYALCYKIAMYYSTHQYHIAENLLFEVKEYLKNAQYTAFRRGNNSIPLEKLEALIEAHVLNRTYKSSYNPTKPSSGFLDKLKMLSVGQHSSSLTQLSLDAGVISSLILNAKINPTNLNVNDSYDFLVLQLWNYVQNQDHDLMPVFQLLSSLHTLRPTLNKLTRVSFIAFCEGVYNVTYLEVILGLLVHLYNASLGDRAEPHLVLKFEIITKSWPPIPREASNELILSTLEKVLEHAVTCHPFNSKILNLSASLNMVAGKNEETIRNLMSSGILVSDGFIDVAETFKWLDLSFYNIVKACMNINAHVEVALLCCMKNPPEYTTSFQALKRLTAHHDLHLYYPLFWDVNLLECAIAQHHKKGETLLRDFLIGLMGKAELNENNASPLIKRTVESKKAAFLRTLLYKFCERN